MDVDKSIIIEAYGLLWRQVLSSPLSSEARNILSSVLSHREKSQGITLAIRKHGNVSEGEIL